MSEAKHTELPWEQHTLLVKNKSGEGVCHTGLGINHSIEKSEGNAEFIVRACNSHYALVEALEKIKTMCADAPDIAFDIGECERIVSVALKTSKR